MSLCSQQRAFVQVRSELLLHDHVLGFSPPHLGKAQNSCGASHGKTYQVLSEVSWIPPPEPAWPPLRARQPTLNVLSKMLCPGSYMPYKLQHCSSTRTMRCISCAAPQNISREAAAEVVPDKAPSSCNAPNLKCTLATEPAIAPGQPKALHSQQGCKGWRIQMSVYLQCLQLRQRPSRWRGRQHLGMLSRVCCSGWRLPPSPLPYPRSPWLCTMHLQPDILLVPL